MKKILLIIAVVLSSAGAVHAQTWDEWFRQKKTQKKYLLQQIAALQVYLNYAKQGYEIADKGINTVRKIKNGDFNLHRDFFGSLKMVNPAIKRYAKVADIIAYQTRIIKQVRQTILNVQETKQFTPEEFKYCKDVFDFLLAECLKTIDELIAVTTSGEFQMKDDERLKRIDTLYTEIQSKYAFCSSFSEEIGLLAVQRFGEQMEINRSKMINGLK